MAKKNGPFISHVTSVVAARKAASAKAGQPLGELPRGANRHLVWGEPPPVSSPRRVMDVHASRLQDQMNRTGIHNPFYGTEEMIRARTGEHARRDEKRKAAKIRSHLSSAASAPLLDASSGARGTSSSRAFKPAPRKPTVDDTRQGDKKQPRDRKSASKGGRPRSSSVCSSSSSVSTAASSASDPRRRRERSGSATGGSRQRRGKSAPAPVPAYNSATTSSSYATRSDGSQATRWHMKLRPTPYTARHLAEISTRP
eukprot:TRINITY_DN5372_c0_g1_i1.p1 TRINITY_DN5372_c0_g1~~TRINITY_DN5372_c0_g1_i1.p1  ORF type:complete len:256 (-),score=29.91 TRINITY_DN5372_c0_g1_i1:187-954(-)